MQGQFWSWTRDYEIYFILMIHTQTVVYLTLLMLTTIFDCEEGPYPTDHKKYLFIYGKHR